MFKNIAVIGASGAVGSGFVTHLCGIEGACVHAFSRQKPEAAPANVIHHIIDYEAEASIASAAEQAAQDAPLDLVVVATGLLHTEGIMPEKSLRDISTDKFLKIISANCVFPALAAKHFLPRLNRDNRAVFAALSARVGSISDNRLGGWYAYRASKAALNMVLKNAAIEIARRNKTAVVVGLHPGTVAGNLSAPFQQNVPEGKLFTPEYSTQKMLQVIEQLTPADSGKCFAWDGEEVLP